MEGLVALVLLYAVLTGVHRLFRVWAGRTGPEAPGAVAILLTIALIFLPLVLFAPQPVRVAPDSGVAGVVGSAIGGGIGRAFSGFVMLVGLCLAVLFGGAMAWGIRSGTRPTQAPPALPQARRPPPLDSDPPAR
ncbi:hypothetical protein [Roseicyclus persicicus]|uniref:Uncharacterized protein n=1 Tax=Roseicyclus persicicus TaxID=2650661 RepID=A0A7X6JWN0_9RHOB|nr:hypothetical protein [Roseibacterium persicicum]NKX43860.1 hypothetical protein [Roseibacterium persicicum]